MKQFSLYQEKSYKNDTFVKERDKSREKFLDSISILIKRILLQCNYIISNELEEKKYSNIEDNYKNFNYPIIEEPCNNETYLNFIKNMDDILLKYYNFDKFTKTNLILFDLAEDLINKMDEIFHFKKLHLSDIEELSSDSLENPFISSENINDYTITNIFPNDISYIKVEEYYAFINSRYKKKDKKIKMEIQKERNNSIEKKDNFNNKKKLGLNKSEIIYMLDCISNRNTKRNKVMEEAVINVLKYKLESHYINTFKDFLIDFLITTEKFTKLSLLEIICNFPKYQEFIELYEFKIIIDTFCKECKIEDYIDNRGNIILTEREYKIYGKDKYCLIPKGWVGIGIKNEDNNEEWRRGFYPIEENLESKEIKEKITNIIVNGFTKEELQKNKSSISLKTIDNKFGIIKLNNVKFGIILMIKINNELIKKRKEKGIELNKNNIKTIAILLKKIK